MSTPDVVRSLLRALAVIGRRLGRRAQERALSQVPRSGERGVSTASSAPVGDQDALAGVVAGRVVVRGPRGRGNYAAVLAPDGVRLRVNGEDCRSAAVREGDRIDVIIDAEEEVHPCRYQVSVSDDRLTADLTVTPGVRILRRLADCDPVDRLELEVREERIPLRPTEDEIRRALAGAGVVYGVDPEAVAQAARATEPLTVTVARGDAPIEPSPSRLVLEVEPESEEIGPLVQVGWRLGRVSPGRPGQPGRAVTGEALAPRRTSTAVVVTGDGVRLSEGVLYAQVDGRLVVHEADGEIHCDVIPLRIVPDDVEGEDLTEDAGDMIVRGLVARSRLRAAGTLSLAEGASHAVLSGQRGVEARRVVSLSVVLAGADVTALAAYHEFSRLAAALQAILEAYQEIARMGMVGAEEWRRSGLRPLIDVLLRRRLAWFPETWRQARERVSGIGGEWADLLEALRRVILEPAGERVEPAAVEDLLWRLQRRLADLEGRTPGTAWLRVHAAIRSRLVSEGGIWIQRGAEESDLIAIGPVVSPGCLRGGRTWSAVSVTARELGSPLEMKTEVAVADGTITAGLLHAGVTLAIAGHRTRVEQARRDCRISVRDGRLTFDQADVDAEITSWASHLKVGG